MMLLAAWALSYWLCDEAGGYECRPVDRGVYAGRGACLVERRAVLRIPDAIAAHCRHERPALRVAARKAAPARQSGPPACPGDQVVWVNTHTRVYHFAGSRWFGHTRVGKYLCRRAADAEGDRATETE